jgi:hypothetical protein
MTKIKNRTKLWQSTAIQLIRFVDENFVCPKIKLFYLFQVAEKNFVWKAYSFCQDERQR